MFFLGHSVYIFLDNVLAINVNKYSVTTASCQQRWRTNWIHFRGRANVGCLVTTSHNKAAVYGLVSQPITAYVSHLTYSCQ